MRSVNVAAESAGRQARYIVLCAEARSERGAWEGKVVGGHVVRGKEEGREDRRKERKEML